MEAMSQGRKGQRQLELGQVMGTEAESSQREGRLVFTALGILF